MSHNKARLARARSFEQIAVIALHGQKWVSAISLAGQIGVKYRPLAFALRRLVVAGVVEERLVQYRGTARSKEYRREYRLRAPRGPAVTALQTPSAPSPAGP